MPLQPGGGTGRGIWLLRDVSEVTRSPQWRYSQVGEREEAGWAGLAGLAGLAWLGWLGWLCGWLGWLAGLAGLAWLARLGWLGWAGLAGVKYRTLWEAGGCIWTLLDRVIYRMGAQF